MKIRSGFVSNSSSSSYIVLLPKNFDAIKYVDNMTDEEIDKLFRWDKHDRSEIKEALKSLCIDGTIYDDNYEQKNICSEVLREYVIADVQTESDGGSISLVTGTEREKIKKLLNIELRYDKLKKLEETKNEN